MTRPSTPRRPRGGMIVILALALVGGACGGDGTEATEGFAPPVTAIGPPTTVAPTTTTLEESAAFEESLASGILSLASGPILGSGETARCVAAAATSVVGVEALREAGAPGSFDLGALSTEDQGLLLEAAAACIDVAALLADSQTTGVELAAESAACVAREVQDRGLVAGIIRAGLTSMDATTSEELAVQLLEAFAACLTPGEIAAVIALLGLGPGSVEG